MGRAAAVVGGAFGKTGRGGLTTMGLALMEQARHKAIKERQQAERDELARKLDAGAFIRFKVGAEPTKDAEDDWEDHQHALDCWGQRLAEAQKLHKMGKMICRENESFRLLVIFANELPAEVWLWKSGNVQSAIAVAA